MKIEGIDNMKVKLCLIRVAGELTRCNYLPSPLVDDYSQKTYSAGRVAQMMEKAHERSKDLGVKVRDLADSINI